MKKILSLLLCVTAFSLTGCEDDTNVQDEVVESNVLMTYVGNENYSMAMGMVDAGHVLEFYKDGTLKITGTFMNTGMGANLVESMEGSYTNDGDEYTLSYSYAESTYTDTFEIVDGQFTGKIWLFMSYPSVDITYYEVNTLDYKASTKILYGTMQNDTNFTAYVVQLYSDNTFVVCINENGVLSQKEGTYEIITYSVSDDKDNEISFTYKVDSTNVNDVFNYSNANAFDYSLRTSTENNDNYVKVIKMQ